MRQDNMAKYQVRPGFFNFDLNVTRRITTKHIYDAKIEMEDNIKKEHNILQPTLRNVSAFFTYHLPLRKRQAKFLFEKNHIDFPTNLNTLGNLAHIYGSMRREKDKQECERKIKVLLADSDEKFVKQMEGRCLFGQAYAMIFDLPEDNNQTAERLLKDAWNFLHFQQPNMSANDRESVMRTKEKTRLAYREASAIDFDNMDERKIALESAISCLESGIDLLNVTSSPSYEIILWKYYLGIAYNRLNYQSVMLKIDKEKLKTVCRKALLLFCEVIDSGKKEQENLTMYIARSFAYIGAILSVRRNILSNEKEYFEKFEHMAEVWKDFRVAFTKAVDLAPKDPIVLNRFGRALNIKRCYENAKKYLTKSIDCESDITLNWFAYSSLSECYYFQYIDIKWKNQHAINFDWSVPKRLLHKSRNIALKNLESKSTAKDFYNAARVCFELGVGPVEHKREYGYCLNEEFIYEAIEYLNQSLEYRDCSRRPKHHFLLGECFLNLGDYRKADESMKRAVESSRWKSVKNFSTLCCYMLLYYKETKNEYLLSEMCCILSEGQKSLAIEKAVTKLCSQKYTNQIHMLMKYMIKKKSRKYVAVLKVFLSVRKNDKSPEMREIVAELRSIEDQIAKVPEEIEEPEFKDNWKEQDLEFPVGLEKATLDEKFRFDFYVSYSPQDEDWVQHILLPALEEENFNRYSFKGCFARRDFIPEKSKPDNIVDSIKASCKILLILTPDFINDKSCQDEIDQALIKLQCYGGCVIPVKLQDCEIPLKLQHLTYLDFTQLEYNWRKLRQSLIVS